MLTRRSFLASAIAASSVSPAGAQSPATVLRLVRRSIEVNGKPATVFGIGQPDGVLGLTAETGGFFRVRLENHLDSPSLIHWHGLTPPWQQDGVPDISAPPVPAGGTAKSGEPRAIKARSASAAARNARPRSGKPA